MWMLPALSPICRAISRTYYRVTVTGSGIPAEGPVLLIANHPNALLDPALVAAAAGRPVRFLAKAPLFRDPQVGWLIRGSGSIPIYRASDDRSSLGRNAEMFSAVYEALAEGAAVGIFPEGTSHNAPSLAPVKSGAARIALGAAARVGAAIPIVPVGLSYRRKTRFRSEAHVRIGEPIAWDDLAVAGDESNATVRELTRRVEVALREVTVNLERWEDAPLVEWVAEIHAAELGLEEEPAARIARLRDVAAGLAALRHRPDGEWQALAKDVARHGRVLAQLRLRPADLRLAPRTSTAVRWTLRQLGFLLVGAPLAAVGAVVFFVPYRLPGIAEARVRPSDDVRSTYKALTGALAFLIWFAILAACAAWVAGPAAAAAAIIGGPALALVTLAGLERWRDARGGARRFLLLRGRRGLHRRLQARQRELAARLTALWERLAVGEGSVAGSVAGSVEERRADPVMAPVDGVAVDAGEEPVDAPAADRVARRR